MATPTATAPSAQFEHEFCRGPAAGTQITPVMRLFRAWQREYAFACARSEAIPDDEGYSFALAGMRQIEQQMIATPCETSEDALAKLLAFTCEGQDFTDNATGTGAAILKEGRHVLAEGGE